MFNNWEQSWKRDCESKVKYEMDNTFQVQGVIKPGADLMTVTKTSKEEVKRQRKIGCSVGRHKGCRRR
jgi:hypothetical protein